MDTRTITYRVIGAERGDPVKTITVEAWQIGGVWLAEAFVDGMPWSGEVKACAILDAIRYAVRSRAIARRIERKVWQSIGLC